jgi:hypothetical protein
LNLEWSLVAYVPHPIVANNKKVLILLKAAFTLVVLIWIILASYITPPIYNYWVIITMEILLFGVWIFGSMYASGARHYPNTGVCQFEDGFKYICPVHSSKSYNAAAYCSFLIIGLAVGLLILWLVSMVVVSVFIARHRKAGGHCKRESETVV